MTILSMTGFGAATVVTPMGLVSAEVRTVNSRFFELHTRIPEELRSIIDPWIRERILVDLPRGKVEVRLSLTKTELHLVASALNKTRLSELLHLGSLIEEQAGGRVQPWQMSELLRWPGVLSAPETDTRETETLLKAVMDQAIQSLREARQREGAALAEAVVLRCNEIEALRVQAQDFLAEALLLQSEKIRARLTEAFDGLSDESLREAIHDRMRQEANAASIRSDISEELDRLGAHLKEFGRVLSDPKNQFAGKRLDFLSQELHREANTIGSKSPSLALTQLSMDMKLAIEQIREQVQNIQ
ncbi:MAG: YicC family protein [Betaproteobacteria bacterium]|nr:YicC family protein [Betaproteobacteria bacterium]